MQQRSELDGTLVLKRAEMDVLCLGLRAAYEDFVEYWGEFVVVAPGKLEAYNLEPGDLLRLASRLESC